MGFCFLKKTNKIIIGGSVYATAIQICEMGCAAGGNAKRKTYFSLFLKRHSLNQSEKDVVFRELQNNSYSRSGIPRGGWMFPFYDVLKRFLVKVRHYGWKEVYAPNKTSVRAYYKSGVLEIIEHN